MPLHLWLTISYKLLFYKPVRKCFRLNDPIMKSLQVLKCSSLLVIFFSKSSPFWYICQVLLCLLPLTLSGASRCQLSIVRCCDSPQQKVLPYRWGTWSDVLHRILWEDWRVSWTTLESFITLKFNMSESTQAWIFNCLIITIYLLTSTILKVKYKYSWIYRPI